MTVADKIAAFLKENGVKHAFGIIGAGNAALFDAIDRLGFTQIVCCHHEQAAVGAAMFYGRTLENVGVALVTTGAGSANAVTGSLAALMDNAPVLIISGNEPSRYRDEETPVMGVQGYRTDRVARFVAKEAWRAPNPETAIELLTMMYDISTQDRPGPTWVDIPRDFFNAAAS